jgi:hypothetical protein
MKTILCVDITVTQMNQIDEIGLAVASDNVYPYGVVFKRGDDFQSFVDFMMGFHSSRSVPWASWGSIDREILEWFHPRHLPTNPMGCVHLNLKNYYSVLEGDENPTLKAAMKRLVSEEDARPKYTSVAAEAAVQCANIMFALMNKYKQKPMRSIIENCFVESYG